MISTDILFIAIPAALTLFMAAAMYRIVPNGEAHVVITPHKTMICTSNPKIEGKVSNWYFAIPSHIPLLGRSIRIMDLKTQEITFDHEANEKSMARYQVKASLKYRVANASVAAETWNSEEELANQLIENVKAAVRAVTIKYDVSEARMQKAKLTEEVEEEILDDLKQYGLEMVTFALVDFNDSLTSKIVSNISLRKEMEIASTTRIENADREKNAKVKEAENEEISRKREIQKELNIELEQKKKDQSVQDAIKILREKEYLVKQVELVQDAENKKKAQAVLKESEKLRGESEQSYLEAKAIGDAAKVKEEGIAKAAVIKQTGLAEAEIIKQKGLAEAEALTKKQVALKAFNTDAIKALIAEKQVEVQREIGIETAKAMAGADVRILIGGNDQGFELSKALESMKLGSPQLGGALLQQMQRPNDLGFTTLPESKVEESKKKSK